MENKEKCEVCEMIANSGAPNTGKPLDKVERLKAFSFIGCFAGLSMLGGFGYAFAQSRKIDPDKFQEGMSSPRRVNTAAVKLETGHNLAARALGWGTLYAVAGVSFICFSIWKLVGAKDLHEFRQKVAVYLPKLRRNDPPTSRTEFDSLTDLMQYCSEWGAANKDAESK